MTIETTTTSVTEAIEGTATNDARRPVQSGIGGTDGTATNDARRPARRHRRIAALVLTALVVAGAGVAVAGPSGPSPATSPDGGMATEAGAEGEEGGGPSSGASWGTLPRTDESGDEGSEEGEEGGGGPTPTPKPQPDPDPEPEPDAEPETEPQPETPPAPAELSVPAELKLKAGVYTGTFSVANVGGAPLDWKAWPDPGVTVDVQEGTLSGGEEVVITFTIDKSQLKAGSFERRIMVDAPDVGAKDLWIAGSKPIDQIVCC